MRIREAQVCAARWKDEGMHRPHEAPGAVVLLRNVVPVWCECVCVHLKSCWLAFGIVLWVCHVQGSVWKITFTHWKKHNPFAHFLSAVISFPLHKEIGVQIKDDKTNHYSKVLHSFCFQNQTRLSDSSHPIIFAQLWQNITYCCFVYWWCTSICCLWPFFSSNQKWFEPIYLAFLWFETKRLKKKKIHNW